MRAASAGFPRVKRRIDIKLYAPAHRVTAVNYYTASALCNRALRYWCDKPPPHVQQMAARLLPGGSHFRLTDHSLTVHVAPGEASQSPAEPQLGVLAPAEPRCEPLF